MNLSKGDFIITQVCEKGLKLSANHIGCRHLVCECAVADTTDTTGVVDLYIITCQFADPDEHNATNVDWVTQVTDDAKMKDIFVIGRHIVVTDNGRVSDSTNSATMCSRLQECAKTRTVVQLPLSQLMKTDRYVIDPLRTHPSWSHEIAETKRDEHGLKTITYPLSMMLTKYGTMPLEKGFLAVTRADNGMIANIERTEVLGTSCNALPDERHLIAKFESVLVDDLCEDSIHAEEEYSEALIDYSRRVMYDVDFDSRKDYSENLPVDETYVDLMNHEALVYQLFMVGKLEDGDVKTIISRLVTDAIDELDLNEGEYTHFGANLESQKTMDALETTAEVFVEKEKTKINHNNRIVLPAHRALRIGTKMVDVQLMTTS